MGKLTQELLKAVTPYAPLRSSPQKQITGTVFRDTEDRSSLVSSVPCIQKDLISSQESPSPVAIRGPSPGSRVATTTATSHSSDFSIHALPLACSAGQASPDNRPGRETPRGYSPRLRSRCCMRPPTWSSPIGVLWESGSERHLSTRTLKGGACGDG